MRPYLLFLLIAGCSPVHYHKEGATRAETRADQKSCYEDSGPFGALSGMAFANCMKERGYEKKEGKRQP